MTDKLPLNKLIIMFILYKVDYTISKSQLEECILEKGYTNYFSLQEDISHLINIDYIHKNVIGNRTSLSLTKEGTETIRMFINHIPMPIKDELLEYLKENSYKLQNATSIECEAYTDTLGNNIFRGLLKEDGKILSEVKVNFPTLELAQEAMIKWKKNSDTIYIKIMEGLL